MATAKLELFDKKLQDTAVMLKALSHPARLAIIKFLAGTNGCFTGDITTIVPLGRTTVNQHLTELKKAGLIQGHITGSKTRYCIIPEKIEALKRALDQLGKELSPDADFDCNG